MGLRYAMAAMDGSLTEEAFYRLWFPAERPDLVELLSTGSKLTNEGQEELRKALSVFAEAI